MDFLGMAIGLIFSVSEHLIRWLLITRSAVRAHPGDPIKILKFHLYWARPLTNIRRSQHFLYLFIWNIRATVLTFGRDWYIEPKTSQSFYLHFLIHWCYLPASALRILLIFRPMLRWDKGGEKNGYHSKIGGLGWIDEEYFNNAHFVYY